jgi:hypothetical protein
MAQLKNPLPPWERIFLSDKPDIGWRLLMGCRKGTRILTLDFQLRAVDFNFPAWHLLKLM